MVDTQIVGRGIVDPRVIKAMKKVPRHCFVEEGLYGQAYGDYPLPIGEKQTISQPYIVALMTEALRLTGTDRVLEIGTGSGYQTAVLAELAYKVYSVERINNLAIKARGILDKLGYRNIIIKFGDGTLGWKEHAPYEAIIVTAGAPKIPEALLEQLADGGRLVIPVGDRFSQYLTRMTKKGDEFKRDDLGGVRFVSLIGKNGWEGEGFDR